MHIFIQICLIILVVYNVYGQTHTCQCNEIISTCIAKNKICIPEPFRDNIQDAHPNPQEIVVELRRVQIIGVNDKLKEITFNAEVTVYWCEGRLQVLHGDKEIYLKPSDAKQVWVPSLALSNNLVSVSHYKLRGGESDEYGMVAENHPYWPVIPLCSLNGLSNNNETNSYISYRSNYYKVTLLCDMKFEKFPFDRQACKFEV